MPVLRLYTIQQLDLPGFYSALERWAGAEEDASEDKAGDPYRRANRKEQIENEKRKAWCYQSRVFNQGTEHLTEKEARTLRALGKPRPALWGDSAREAKMKLLERIWRKKTNLPIPNSHKGPKMKVPSHDLSLVIYYARVKFCDSGWEDFTFLKKISFQENQENDNGEREREYLKKLTMQFRTALWHETKYKRALCGVCQQEYTSALNITGQPGTIFTCRSGRYTGQHKGQCHVIFMFDDNLRSVCPSPTCMSTFLREGHKVKVKELGERREVVCSYCGLQETPVELFKCARCRAVEYCSRECQQV